MILVEGDDDLFTLSNYIGKNSDPVIVEQYRTIQFFPFAQTETQSKGGLDALRYALEKVRKIPGFHQIRALGVICDADYMPHDSTTSAKQAATAHIQSALRDSGLTVPSAAEHWEPFASSDLPTLQWIGFIVVPPNRDSGCLETMLWESVSDKVADLKDCAESLLTCAEPIYACRFKERVASPNHSNWRDKVRVHALLAASEEPQTYTTDATLRGYWDFDSPGLSRVLAFLRDGQLKAISESGNDANI